MPFLFPFVTRNLFLSQIVELLLDNGAHIDLRNAHGQRPTSMLRNIPGCQINPLKYTSLRCLAAAAVTQHGLRYLKMSENIGNSN